ATVARGMGLFDTDLAGGTSVVFILREKMSDQDVRKTLNAKFSTMTHEKTGGRVDFTVYEIDFSGQEKQTVYKVDSNIPDDKMLQKAVQEAFRTSKGEEGLQTHKLVVGKIQTTSKAATGLESDPGTSSAPGPFEDAPRDPEPATKTTPKTGTEEAAPAKEKEQTA